MDASVTREIARSDIPSTSNVKICARFATDSLFIFIIIHSASISVKQIALVNLHLVNLHLVNLRLTQTSEISRIRNRQVKKRGRGVTGWTT